MCERSELTGNNYSSKKINDLSILNIDYSLQVEEVIDEQASEAIE